MTQRQADALFGGIRHAPDASEPELTITRHSGGSGAEGAPARAPEGLETDQGRREADGLDVGRKRLRDSRTREGARHRAHGRFPVVGTALCAGLLAAGAWLCPSILTALAPRVPASFAVSLHHHVAPPSRAAIEAPGTRLDPRFTAPTLTAGTASDTVTASLPRGATFEPSVVAVMASFEIPAADELDASAPLTPAAGVPLTQAAGVPLTEQPLNLLPLSRAEAQSPDPAGQIALPLPLSRPSPSRMGLDQTQPIGRRRMARLTQAPAVRPDPRSLFDKFFGVAQPPNTVLAYAAPEDGSPGLLSGARRATIDSRTAVYDIAAHTVTLPDGTRLEAHSGLGASLDDPRSVTEHMRGATPPNVYELSPREALFHGVAALRLTPIGGTTYGRGGLLAHTYMLGPRGDSNGCVVFRDYKTFRRAFDTGQINRLVVVASVG